ncbi:MAG: UbiA family prenyltransferase [Candidatus Firestonebacteria bacterium]
MYLKKIESWAKLLRLPNIFTLPGDVLVGFLIGNLLTNQNKYSNLFLLMTISVCLYLSGILLNDLFDIKQDKLERPSRPLAAGIINPSSVLFVTFILIFISLFISKLLNNYTFIVTIILIVLIFLYNGVVRKISPVLGFMVMGLCRGMNIILGASENLTALPDLVILIAIIETGYVAIISAVAYKEVVVWLHSQPTIPSILFALWKVKKIPSKILILIANGVIASGLLLIMVRTGFSILGVLSSILIIVNILIIKYSQVIVTGKITSLIRSLILLQSAFILIALPNMLQFAIILYALWFLSLLLSYKFEGS